MMNSFILTLESLFSSSIKKIAYGKIIESSIVKNSKLVEHFVEPSHINSIKVNENGYILSKMDFTSARTLISKMLEDSYNDISSKDILSPIESNLIKMFDYQMIQRLNEFLGVLILSKLSIEKTTWDIGSIGYMGLDIENYFVSFSFDLDGKKCEFSLCFPKYLLSQYIDKFEEIKGV
jgi:flagellar motor switch protein FliM